MTRRVTRKGPVLAAIASIVAMGLSIAYAAYDSESLSGAAGSCPGYGWSTDQYSGNPNHSATGTTLTSGTGCLRYLDDPRIYWNAGGSTTYADSGWVPYNPFSGGLPAHRASAGHALAAVGPTGQSWGWTDSN